MSHSETGEGWSCREVKWGPLRVQQQKLLRAALRAWMPSPCSFSLPFLPLLKNKILGNGERRGRIHWAWLQISPLLAERQQNILIFASPARLFVRDRRREEILQPTQALLGVEHPGCVSGKGSPGRRRRREPRRKNKEERTLGGGGTRGLGSRGSTSDGPEARAYVGG